MLKAEEFGLAHRLNEEAARRIAQRIKQLESKGFSFENAGASVDLLIRRGLDDYDPPFETIDFMVVAEHPKEEDMLTEARIKLRIDNRVIDATITGRDLVDALDAALRNALLPTYPVLEKVQLTGYSVHILDGAAAKAVATRVFIHSSKGNRSWSTVGCSANILEAIWQALVDSLVYALLDEPAADA